jgi:protein-L-isoaspartate(D-aspartate) O-methyltransferase
MARVPRHIFVTEKYQSKAYADEPLPIQCGQTISQPYMVAIMTEWLELDADSVVLEIGTGTGYQAAILGSLAKRVISIERHEPLAELARENLRSISVDNVTVRVGDGTLGAQDEAPFDAIIVTAGAPEVPNALIEQLAMSGRLICPVGDRDSQKLFVINRRAEGLEQLKSTRCRFVPLIGAHGWSA